MGSALSGVRTDAVGATWQVVFVGLAEEVGVGAGVAEWVGVAVAVGSDDGVAEGVGVGVCVGSGAGSAVGPVVGAAVGGQPAADGTHSSDGDVEGAR